MIHRDFTPDALNRIANAPDVAPTFGFTNGGRMDFGEVAARTADHVILTDGLAVAAIAEWSAPGVWQVHIMARAEARGGYARDRFRECVAWMWAHGASHLWAQVGAKSRNTSLLARMVGFCPAGSGHHPVIGAVDYFEARRW